MNDSPDSRGSIGSILVTEDDPDIAASLEMILGGEGYSVTLCDDGLEAMGRAGDEEFDLVLTDFRLPGMGGLELIQRLRESKPSRPVILMTAHGNPELAIEATKLGAFDYLRKPFDLEELIEVVAKGVKAGRSGVRQKKIQLGGFGSGGEPGLLGNCKAMQQVYKEIGRIAPTDVTVLILGETGSGKELLARAIYQHSDRAGGPFVAVNCGAIPENLLESELFGHVRGAFTGATADRMGRFQQASGGTLFLDEIGDLPLPVQVKLLRVLQERVVQPLGGGREIPVDVRIVAATHQPLTRLIEKKEFREDLFYRINSAVITLPPLRERGEDIGELIRVFLTEAAADFRTPCPVLSRSVMKRLEEYGWPGNVRELRNVTRQLMLRSRGFEVTWELVEQALRHAGDKSGISESGNFESTVEPLVREAIEEAKNSGANTVHRDLVQRLERLMIQNALEMSGGHLGKVAEWLGISRVTLRKKMADLDLNGR